MALARLPRVGRTMTGGAPGDMPVLAGYQLDGRIGAGSSGTVYRARRTSSGEILAVKVLAAELVRDAALLAEFRAEAATMASFSSPHLVGFVELVESGTLVAIVSELVDGASLRSVIRHAGRLAPEQAAGVLSGSLRGLDVLHRGGLVHRDVKPDNIIVDRAGVSKLVDFGLARPAAGAREGAGIGSPAYMSPEQVSGHGIGPASDLYSSGATLFELLTGRPPFPGADVDEILQAHVSRPAPDPRDVEPAIPAPMADLVGALLAKDPQRRPASAAVLIDRLQRAAAASYGPDWETRAELGAAVAVTLAGLGTAALVAGGSAVPAALGGAGAAAGAATSGGGAATASSAAAGTVATGSADAGATLAGAGGAAGATPAPTGVLSRMRRAVTAHPAAAAVAAVVVVGAAVGAAVAAASGSGSPAASTSSTALAAASTTTATDTSVPATGPTAPPSGSGGGGAAAGQYLTWSAPASIDSIGAPLVYLQSVSCASPTSCVAVDRSGDAVTFTAGSWGSPQLIDSGNALSVVDCLSGSWCMAVDWSGNALQDRGGSWTSRAVDPNGGGFYSLSCVDAGAPICVAGDHDGRIYEYRGGSWSGPLGSDRAEILGISCESATFCVAVDQAGNAMVYRGAAWSAPLGYVKAGFAAVSCPRPDFCLAASADGQLLDLLPGGWHTLAETDEDGAGEFSISCIAGTYACTIADDSGHVITYGLHGWSQSLFVDKVTSLPSGDTPALDSVSCPSASFCMAVDVYGNALRGDAAS